MNTTQPPTSPTRLSLAEVITAVLGDLAYMISDDQPAPPGSVWLRGEISYDGPAQGTLSCWCTREFAAQLAANLLGTEVNACDPAPETEDALREFMNVLCGQLVVAWYGKTDVFSLGIPTADETTELPAKIDTDDYCQMPVNGTPLHFLHRQHRPG
jgi:hypothetical protein